jgi:hypothetical protein
MIIVGLLLVVAGVVFGIDVAVKNRFPVRDLEVFGSTLGFHHAEQIFVLGVITGAVILFGLALLIGGIVRSRSRNVVAHRGQRRQAVENTQGAADLDGGNQRQRPPVEEQSRTSTEYVDGASVSDSGETGTRESRVSPGLGGSTALDRGAP